MAEKMAKPTSRLSNFMSEKADHLEDCYQLRQQIKYEQFCSYAKQKD